MVSNKKIWEKSIILMLNTFDGWDLDHAPADHYTAVGETPKGFPCVMKIKFDDEDPYIDGATYKSLMNDLPADMVKLYLYNNREANYMFWLNEIKIDEITDIINLNKEDATITQYNN